MPRQRSLKAPLSISEEMTLRRVALGQSDMAELPEQPVARLHAMGLIDDANQLTAAGRQRYENLTRPAPRDAVRDQRLVSFLTAVQKRTLRS